MPDTARVDTPSDAYNAMAERWELLEDLCGGTKAMRDASTKWLPMEPKESYEGYKVRLDRSFLFEALKDTIRKCVAKPFSKPVTVQGELPEILQALEENVDKAGKTLSQFLRESFETAIKYGLTHAIYDFSRMERSSTLADVRAGIARPAFIHVEPRQIIGWRTRIVNNQSILTQIRVKETVTIESGDFGEQGVEQITVWTEDSFTKYQKGKDAQVFTIVEEGPHSAGRVPIETLYLDYPTATLEADPPLEGLAWKNLEHWQKSSDHNNILRFARVPVRFASGVSDEDVNNMSTVGAGILAWSTNPDARMVVVEHSGAAIKASQEDIDRVQQEMETLGLQPFVRRAGASTATGRVLDKDAQVSDLQAWIKATERWVEQLYRRAAEMTRVELPEDFSIDIFSDFGLSGRAAKEVDQLIAMRDKRQITNKTALEESKRRGFFAETLDVEAELAALEEEKPPGAEELIFGGGERPGPPDPDDDEDEDEEEIGADDEDEDERNAA